VAPRLRLNLTAWPAAFLALAALSALLFAHDAVRGPAAAWAPGLEWRADSLWSEPWRLLSAALVHHDLRHLGANLAGCAAVALFGWVGRLPWHATLAAALAWPLTHAALLWAPGLARYGGLSGVLHAAVAVAALHLLLHERGRARLIGALVWGGLVAKVLTEAPWRSAVQTQPGWDFPIAVGAHAAGLVCGTVVMMGLAGLTGPANARQRSRARQ
jgi:rhomboid family GlyGly-CTERM serine protease